MELRYQIQLEIRGLFLFSFMTYCMYPTMNLMCHTAYLFSHLLLIFFFLELSVGFQLFRLKLFGCSTQWYMFGFLNFGIQSCINFLWFSDFRILYSDLKFNIRSTRTAY